MKQYTVVMMGSTRVGKTTLALNFTKGLKIDDYTPTVLDEYHKYVFINNEVYLLKVIDTSGTLEFPGMRNAQFSGGQGFIFMFSITEKYTLDELRIIMEQLVNHRDTADVPMIFVGNKCDLETQREVNEEEALLLAIEFDCHYMETSVPSNINVAEVFLHIIADIDKRANLLPKVARRKTCDCM